jgi:iron complex outermembrane receptor protein
LKQLVLLCLCAMGALRAQVTGRVVDASKSAIGGANVRLDQRTTVTNDQGDFAFPAVPPGHHALTIEKSGFAKSEQEIDVAFRETGGEFRVPGILLTPESVKTTVTVKDADSHPLLQEPMAGKTGTKLEDLPSTVTVVDRDLIESQGGVALKDTIRDASGIAQGGGDSFGFADRFLIRGLDARILNDGFSDGDQRNGIPHSLNGVEQVEILEGPGSSLFGSGPPGGSINLVHYTPSPMLLYGGTLETGSFGMVSANAFVTGPTGFPGLNYRIDALAQHSDGFRSLASGDYEIRPAFSWALGRHLITLTIDARDIDATPDPAGLIYVNGSPIQGVSRETKYSTPFSHGNQTLVRTSLSDVWSLSRHLTIMNRFSYMYRNLSILRNGDSGTVTGIVFNGRQLREQHDVINDFDYQFEPVWSFRTGAIRHTLLTGFEAQRQNLHSNRATADLPNITNIFDPVIPETSTAGLNFLRDATHSGDIDLLTATYLGIYVADQIDLTSRLKVRLTGRKDWWDTDLTPQIFVPGRIYQGTQLFEPGVTYARRDAPLSASAGILYRLFSGISTFVGISRSNLAVFSSESTQSGVHAPESALQYEAGLKIAEFHDRVTLTAAAFDVKRDNVFTLVGDTPFFNNQATRGIDANLQVRLSQGWKIFANGTAQHAVLTANPSSPASTGKEPQGVAPYIFNVWSVYDFTIAGKRGFRVGGGVNYRDKMFGNTLNTNAVPAFTRIDAVLSYTPREWGISIGCRNLTNTLYFIAANGAGAFVGDPRTFFVELRGTFGKK